MNVNITIKLPGWDTGARIDSLKETLMAAKEDLDAKLVELRDTIVTERQEVSAAVNDMSTAIDGLTQKVADLEAQLGQPLDLSGEIEQVQTAIDEVKGIVTRPEPPPVPEPEPAG